VVGAAGVVAAVPAVGVVASAAPPWSTVADAQPDRAAVAVTNAANVCQCRTCRTVPGRLRGASRRPRRAIDRVVRALGALACTVEPMSSSATSTRAPSALRAVLPPSVEIRAARRRLHWKAVSIVAVFAVGYVGLVLADVAWGWKVLAAVTLVHATLALATGVMHDANHGSFSASRRVNRFFAYTADALGASSWLWRANHNVAHHHWTNVPGRDDDIELQPFARLAPDQPHRPWHRFQHLYLWPLYGFLAMKWFLFGDFVSWVKLRRATEHRDARFWRSSAAMVAGKAFHCGWAIIIPLLLHPAWKVLAVYVVCSWLVGFALAVIFQLAHCVDTAEFVTEPGSLTGDDAMVHQLATTVDFEVRPRVLRWYATWLLGGLDHQVEHHIAPRLPHTVYRTLAVRVDEVCESRGWARRRHRSFSEALAAHTRHLYAMGHPSRTPSC
jgi:linoleoyl-CoA desaturase